MNNRVQVFQQIPHPVLRPFIRRFLHVEFPRLLQDTHLPDTGPTAAFSLQGECRIESGKSVPPIAFTGLWQTLRTHEHRENHRVVLVSFTPLGASAFLLPPQEEFTGRTVGCTEVFSHPEDLRILHEQLVDAPDRELCIQHLEEFLLNRLHATKPDTFIEAAVSWLEQTQGNRRIHDLAAHIGLSQSALERRFRRVVGISPKKFAATLRLQNAVRLRASGADFAAIAHAAGYFDQPHFIKDFRRATGSTPNAFFRTTN